MHLPVKRTPRVRHNEPEGYSASEPRGTAHRSRGVRSVIGLFCIAIKNYGMNSTNSHELLPYSTFSRFGVIIIAIFAALFNLYNI